RTPRRASRPTTSRSSDARRSPARRAPARSPREEEASLERAAQILDLGPGPQARQVIAEEGLLPVLEQLVRELGLDLKEHRRVGRSDLVQPAEGPPRE